MIRLKSLLTETVVKDPNFISYIKSVEGLGKGSTEKKHVAYYDTVGKVWTIGYGHTGNVKSSMTWPAAVAEQYLIDDLMKAETIVLDFVKRNYPTFKLGTTQTQMLTDFAFNLGGLGKFPTFTKAVVTKNWKVAAQEYKRYGDGKELTNRNEQFYKTFLAPLLASQSSKSKQITPYISVTYTLNNPPYADLLRNPVAERIVSVLKQSPGYFNDYEAWAEAAFMAIKTKVRYDQVKKLLKQDPYAYVKDFMDTSTKYHKQSIDTSYKSLT